MVQLNRYTAGFQFKDYTFEFKQLDNADAISQYNGTLVFNEGEDLDTDIYIEAGKVNVDQQIEDAKFTDLLSLDRSVVINPFLQMNLTDIQFGLPTVQGNEIFVSDFSTSVQLTPSTQGIHLPEPIFDYLETQFFSQICTSVPNFAKVNRTQPYDLSQVYLALDQCECKGRDYGGMPTLAFLVNKEKESGDSDDNKFYMFTPSQFELFPKVNKIFRATFCNLGIWNIEEQYPNVKQTTQAAYAWALGQVFIRENNLSVQWVQNTDQQFEAVIAFKIPSESASKWLEYTLASTSLLIIIAYVWLLTRTKFERIKEQKDQFKKLKLITSSHTTEIDESYAEIFKAQHKSDKTELLKIEEESQEMHEKRE